MILDVPVPIGFCFDVIFKAVNPLFWCIFSKTNISSRRNYHFWGLWEFAKYSTWHVLMWFLRPLTPYSGAYFQKQAFRLDETTIFGVCENSQKYSTWHVLMRFLRPLTPYSGAYFQKQAFRLDETTIFGVCENSQTNSTWHVLMWFLRPLTPYSGAYFQKQAFRLDETTIFGVCENFQNISKYSTWHVLIPVLVTATLGVLPRTFADLDCLRYNASTTWTHGKFQRTYNSVAWRMSGKFQRTYNSVAWRMSGKFQRTYNSVAWRMSGKFQRTYSNVAWRMSGKFQRTYREACPSSASSHERYYMPHPTPPMCTKHHGLLKAVVQLYIYIYYDHVPHVPGNHWGVMWVKQCHKPSPKSPYIYV